MPVIDTYTIFGAWPAGGADLSLDQLKKALSGKDIRAAIAHSTDSVFETTPHTIKDLLAKVSDVPGLVPAAAIDPTILVRPWEFAEQIAKHNFACARFFPEVHNWPVHNYEPFMKCLEAIAPSGMPVSIAITSPGQITALSRIDILREMRVLLVHLADDCASEVAAVIPKYDTWYVSTDGLTHFGLLEELAATISAQKMLFGSTAPRGSIEGSLRYVKRSSLSDSDKEAVLYGNAVQFFGGRLGIN